MRYRVSMPDPHSHLFEVEAVLADPGPSPVLAMPVWTPGSYLVREFARHLEAIEADDGDGRSLPVVRLDKHRFRVDAGGASRVRVRYRVYANELTVRTAHLDGSHGFFNGANLFLYARHGSRRVTITSWPTRRSRWAPTSSPPSRRWGSGTRWPSPAADRWTWPASPPT
jgi:predicted metalloprotease with PDZ domain